MITITADFMEAASHTGKSYGTRLTNPDFAKYAESFGIKDTLPKI